MDLKAGKILEVKLVQVNIYNRRTQSKKESKSCLRQNFWNSNNAGNVEDLALWKGSTQRIGVQT